MNPQGPQNALPFGPYLLLRRIAVGGMAELYLGSEPRAGRFIVLKRILPHMAEEPEFVKMFLDEARIAGSLHHPNIIDVYELGQIDKSIFITMEWVEGMDLRRVLQREQARGGVVPPGIAAWLMARLCEGLQYAHTRQGDDGRPLGIIHRDVSPQNVMVSYQGEVKLVDFGIAKATAWLSRSKPGVIKGKFLYLSPEQLAEEALDSRADLFSLGTMLYELTCGRSPFYRPETEGVIYAIRVEEPPPPHTLRAGYPLSLSRIIQKCLVKDRERRYQTADEIRLALEDALLVDMPTTQVDVINYIAGLFGNEVERTGVYVPPNVPVHELKKRGAPTLAEHNQNEDDDDERTAAMPAPVGYQPPQATLQDGDHDPDDEPTARTGVDRPLASAPEPTYPMNERPGPPVPNDVQDVSYQSVPFSSAPVSTERSERQQSASSPSVQVDLEALLTTPVFSKNAKTSEPSVPTELQIPAYPPSAGPLVRPGPPVDPESLSSATRTEAALGTRPEPPARQPPPQPRMVGPGPTNLNPLDPLETGEPKALKPKRSKRIVKRRVAGDPEDHLATVDFRDAEASPSANTWFIAATIVLAAFAVVMIAWLVWPAAPLQLPDSPPGPPQAEPLPVVKSPQSKPLPGLVNVQFRAAKTTKLFVDGAAINPGEIRAVPPGPLTVAYRCPPTKRDQRPRELTLSNKLYEGAAQHFNIEVTCP